MVVDPTPTPVLMPAQVASDSPSTVVDPTPPSVSLPGPVASSPWMLIRSSLFEWAHAHSYMRVLHSLIAVSGYRLQGGINGRAKKGVGIRVVYESSLVYSSQVYHMIYKVVQQTSCCLLSHLLRLCPLPLRLLPLPPSLAHYLLPVILVGLTLMALMKLAPLFGNDNILHSKKM